MGVIVDSSKRSPVLPSSCSVRKAEWISSRSLGEDCHDDRGCSPGFGAYDALNLAVQLKVPTAFLPAVAQAITGLYHNVQGLQLPDRRDQSAGPDQRREGHCREIAASPLTIRRFIVTPSLGSRWPARLRPLPRNWIRSPGGSRRETSGGPVISPRWCRRSKD